VGNTRLARLPGWALEPAGGTYAVGPISTEDKKYGTGRRQCDAQHPFYAIQIDPALAEAHEPLTDEETWIRANVNSIEQLGPEVYLRNLLSVLKGNYLVPKTAR